MKKIIRKINRILGTFLLMVGYNGYAHAVDMEEPTSVTPLLEFVGRTLNVLVSISGTAFSIMVLLSAYKYAMARGDPKGILGAKQTLTMAVTGLIIVVGFYTIMSIIAGVFGVTSAFADPTGNLKSGFDGLIKAINDCNAGLSLSGCGGL
jgi:hypothetical protein